MKKSIFLFFAAILCVMSVQGAASKQFNNQQFLYCIVENTNWNGWGIKYNWYWDSGSWYAEENGTKISENHWYAKVPNAYIGGVQFIRCSKDLASKWDWSVTKNSNTRTDNKINCAKITGSNWGDAAVSWTTYAPPMSSVTLSNNGTAVNSGSGTEADPYIIEIGTTIKVKAEGTKAVEDPDATINYDFKQGSTSKQNGTGTTWTLTASDASTVYTINLDGYTKVNTTSSSTKTADALYFKTVADATLPTYQVTATANDNTMGTVIGTGEYSEGITVTLTATAADGYKFINWTVGGAEVSTANPYTFTAEEDVTVVANFEELPKTTVYFVNTPKWTSVKAYAYSPENHTWPGVDATKEAEKIGEYEVYSYTATQGKYANVIFNGSGGQTADLDWTADKYYIHNYNGNTGWYTKEEAEALLVVPVVEETIYFVNNKKWTKVQAYAWNNSANNVWPGVVLTATGEKVADYDVYSYTAPQGYVNVIFNNKTGETGVQSADFVWTNGKYYYMDADANYAGGTKEEVAVLVAPDPLATEVYLAGDMTNKDNWDVNKKEFKKATAEATTASVTVNLTAKSYTFKLVIDGAWKGNTGTMTRGGDAVHEGGWSFDKDGYDDNCKIVADIAGDYTFTWDLTTKKLTVTYPALPKHQVTATVNPAETGEVTGIGEYEQGSEATLVATPAAGYAFKNWTVGGTEKSTEATYTFTVNEPISLVANFIPEVTHEVTVSYLCNSNPIPGHDATTLAVGVTTPSTITAPSITNYTFNGWTLGNGIQTEDDATDNPIHITAKAEGEYTLTANYTKIELTYTVKVPEGTEKCYIAGDMNGWSFQEMTPTANANEFTITIDGATTAHKYKYTCGEGWAYVEKKEDGSELDADRTYNANDVVAKWAEPAKCYLMGIGGDWTTGIEMEEDGDQFKLLCQPIAQGEQFKFKYGDTWTTEVENYDANGVDWVESYPGSGQYNITLPAGNYDFYYKKNDNKVWIGICTPATPTPDYTRDVRQGYYGTICLPTAGQMVGASIFEIAYKDASKIYFDEIVSGEMEAGIPYIFLPNEGVTTLKVFYTEMAVVAAGSRNGLVGSYTQELLAVDGNNYILLNNQYCEVIGEAYVGENRAYFQLGSIPDSAPAPAHGVRRVSMGMAGQNTATGMENIDSSAQPVKTIINGQLFILRGEKMYDAQGKLVK